MQARKNVHYKAISIGVIRYLGATAFKEGIWCGIELDTETGLNGGTVQGITYFTCPPRHGIFKKADRVLQEIAEDQALRSIVPSGTCTPRFGGLSRQASQESIASRSSIASYRSHR